MRRDFDCFRHPNFYLLRQNVLVKIDKTAPQQTDFDEFVLTCREIWALSDLRLWFLARALCVCADRALDVYARRDEYTKRIMVSRCAERVESALNTKRHVPRRLHGVIKLAYTLNPDGMRPSRYQQEEETWRKQNSKDWQLCYFVWSSLSAVLR